MKAVKSIKGFIKLYRSLLGSVVWRKPTHSMWWIDLLLSAAYQPTIETAGDLSVALAPGQLMLSLNQLRELFAYEDNYGNEVTPCKNSVVNFLRFLEENELISRDYVGNKKHAVITIIGYDNLDYALTKARRITKTTDPTKKVVTVPKKAVTPATDAENSTDMGITEHTHQSAAMGIVENTHMGVIGNTDMGITEHTHQPTPLDTIDIEDNKKNKRTSKETSSLRSDTRGEADKNQEYFDKFFCEQNLSRQMVLCKNFGLGPNIEALKQLAREIITEWELADEQHPNFNDWARHLQIIMRRRAFEKKRYSSSASNRKSCSPAPQRQHHIAPNMESFGSIDEQVNSAATTAHQPSPEMAALNAIMDSFVNG